MAASEERHDLVESDDYYAWLGLSSEVSTLYDDSCLFATFALLMSTYDVSLLELLLLRRSYRFYENETVICKRAQRRFFFVLLKRPAFEYGEIYTERTGTKYALYT